MKAVINATPLIALALLDRLDLLRQMFDEVIIPLQDALNDLQRLLRGEIRIAPRWQVWFETELNAQEHP